MQPVFKTILRQLLPKKLFDSLRKWRNGVRTRSKARKKAFAFNQFVKYNGLIIRQGPFAGIKYLSEASGSELLPKLIGCYESELHVVIDEIILARYDRIIDIGCAEGYYAVGLAYRCPWAKVEAYDIDREARLKCQTMASLNSVTRNFELKAKFDVGDFVAMDNLSTLILCDCEGAEHELFGKSDASRWQDCDLLIELHDAVHPGTTASIIANLASSHNIRLIDSRDPRSEDIPSLWFLKNRFDRRLAVSEERFPMQWAWLTRRSN